jgi:hypothetical protein
VAPFELFGRNFCLATLQHHFLNSSGGLGGGGSEIIFAETHSIYMQFNRPPPAQLVCVCLSLCVVHAQCCQVPGSPCRTGPAGIEQIRSLVSVVLHTDTYRPGRQVFSSLTTLTQYCCDRQLGGTVYAGLIETKWRISVVSECC